MCRRRRRRSPANPCTRRRFPRGRTFAGRSATRSARRDPRPRARRLRAPSRRLPIRSSSEDDLDDDLATFARGYRSTRLVSRVTEEWTRLARLSVASANAHHRRVSLHGVFRSWRNVVAGADVAARIATRFARGSPKGRLARVTIVATRRGAIDGVQGEGTMFGCRRSPTDEKGCGDDDGGLVSSRRDDDIVHRLVDDVAREGLSAVGTISAPTPDAFVGLEVEGSDVESSVRSAAGGEVRRESETSFAGNTCSEEEFENGGGRRDDPEVASPLDADAVADAKEAADSAIGVDEICHESEVSFAGDTCSEEKFDERCRTPRRPGGRFAVGGGCRS